MDMVPNEQPVKASIIGWWALGLSFIGIPAEAIFGQSVGLGLFFFGLAIALLCAVVSWFQDSIPQGATAERSPSSDAEKAEALLTLSQLTGQMKKDVAVAAEHVAREAQNFFPQIFERFATVAKEQGISNEQAQAQLFGEFEARKLALIQQGISADKAEDQAFKEVFKV